MTLSCISLPWLSAATATAPPAVWGLWGGVAVCYLLLFLMPALLSARGQKSAAAVTRVVLSAVLLLLHVGGIYAMLYAKISLSWVLAALLSSATVGISLGNLQGVLFPRSPAGAAPTETATESPSAAEADAPDGDGDAPDVRESEQPLVMKDFSASEGGDADTAPASVPGAAAADDAFSGNASPDSVLSDDTTDDTAKGESDR